MRRCWVMNVISNLIKPNRFIGEAQVNHWFDTDMSVFHCTFNPGAYQNELYGEFEIESPFLSAPAAVIKRRAEFLAGRYCAKKSLEMLGVFNIDIPIGKDRSPVWPNNVVGSISHNSTHAVAVSGYRSHTQSVGVDIEAFISNETIDRLKNEVVNVDELHLLACMDISFIFTLIFSIKESFFKAAYPLVKNYFDFDAVSVLAINRAARMVKFRINKSLSGFLQAGCIFTGQYKCVSVNNVATFVALNAPMKRFSIFK